MQFPFEVYEKPDFSLVKIFIPQGQKLKVETGSMASMDSNLKQTTALRGGLKRFVSGESLFLNTYEAIGKQGEITLAPGPSGDIGHYHINSQNQLALASGSFLASTEGVKIDPKWQGLGKAFFSGAGLFIMHCSGEGQLWFNSYGALIEIDVDGEYVVDNNHIVAFETSLQYHVTKVAGYKSLFFSGEGLVCRFQGRGKVFIQSKSPSALVSWADAFRPIKTSNNS